MELHPIMAPSQTPRPSTTMARLTRSVATVGWLRTSPIRVTIPVKAPKESKISKNKKEKTHCQKKGVLAYLKVILPAGMLETSTMKGILLSFPSQIERSVTHLWTPSSWLVSSD